MNSGTYRRGWVRDEAAGSGGIVAAACARSARGDGDVVRDRDEGAENRRRRRLRPVVVFSGAVAAAFGTGFFAPDR